MEFREETIKSFNDYRDTTLTDNMTFSEAVDNIDEANNDYFYISMRKEDVEDAYNVENDGFLDVLEFVYIIELGIYIALKH